MKKYFGTDGIRGKVGKQLINAEFMLKLGWACGQILAKLTNPMVIIGHDTRNSGTMIESALQAGLSAAGVDVSLLGVLPTPAVAYLTRSMRADAGIVISASHNPFYDNGVKFFNAEGMKFNDDFEYAIEDFIEKPMRTVTSNKLGVIRNLVEAPGRYIEFCKSTYPNGLSLKNLNIVIDCANGATYNVAPKMLTELGARVTSIGNRPDGFNINQECGATNVAALQQKVVSTNADLGIALDGDGDRLIMVDNVGERVDGDELLAILALDKFSRNIHDGVVGTVMTNLGLEQLLKQHNIPFTRTAVGDRYVLDELVKRKWTLGGESSGHIVNLDLTTTGDGMITALQILRVMQQQNKSLHTLKSKMQKCPQILINVPVSGDNNTDSYPRIAEAVKEAELKLAQRGRILLRPSGTEPLVRVMVEGEDENQVKAIAVEVAKVVEEEMVKDYSR